MKKHEALRLDGRGNCYARLPLLSPSLIVLIDVFVQIALQNGCELRLLC